MRVPFVLCLAGCMTLSMVSTSQAKRKQTAPKPQFTVTGRTVVFNTERAEGGMILRVTGPDGSASETTFRPGEIPFYDLAADALDGRYTYEIRSLPKGGLITRTGDEESQPSAAEMSWHDSVLLQGSFLVKLAEITDPGTGESGVAFDIVQGDDVVVIGSLGVGLDSFNNQDFGFSTILLKENNTRITFDDTSNSSSFPANDWQLTANDSTDGGLNRFSIEDLTKPSVPFTIEAGAPSNSLYVDNGGRVGFKTSNPFVQLHTVDGNTPTLRLEQNSSSGFTAQTWDIAGNETNFFVRDATNGSKLPFKIKPGAPDNTLFISSAGYIGINTGSPSYPIHLVRTGSTPALVIERTDGATAQMATTQNVALFGSRSNHNVHILANNSAKVAITTAGQVGIGLGAPTHMLHLNGGAYSDGNTWEDASSREYKENIARLEADEATSALRQLEPVKFHYKTDAEDERVGFIAEDVPDLVATKGRKALSPMDLVAVLTKVVQEQQETIQDLQRRIGELERKQSGAK
jgi:hypothetical protein